jgi:hypothetical protein
MRPPLHSSLSFFYNILRQLSTNEEEIAGDAKSIEDSVSSVNGSTPSAEEIIGRG